MRVRSARPRGRQVRTAAGDEIRGASGPDGLRARNGERRRGEKRFREHGDGLWNGDHGDGEFEARGGCDLEISLCWSLPGESYSNLYHPCVPPACNGLTRVSCREAGGAPTPCFTGTLAWALRGPLVVVARLAI